MTVLAFLFTFTQLALALLGYAMDSQPLFSMVVYYGSPFYLFVNMFSRESVLFSGNFFYIGIFIFHVFKYVFIFRAQLYGDRGFLFWMTVLFEITYLVLCGYYFN